MKSYLSKIMSNQSINYSGFIKKAKSFKIDEFTVKSTFRITKDSSRKGSYYYLSVRDSDKYDLIFSRFNAQNENKKVEMSLYGNSKKAKSSFSFLLVKVSHDDLVPQVVVFDGIDYVCDFKDKLKKKLIIIENEDNFGNIASSFKDERVDLNDFSFVLGFGNYISDRNFSRFLSNFSEIRCFFDIDLGGLKTFTSLESNLSTSVSFFYSKKMSDYLSKYGNKIKEKDYIAVRKYQKNNKLKTVVKDILHHKKFAEQEIFQH